MTESFIKVPDFPVVDYHIHLPVKRKYSIKSATTSPVIQEHRQKLQEKFRAKWGFPKPNGIQYSPDEAAKLWKEEQRKFGLDKINIVTSGGDNDVLSQVIEMYPETFTGFCHHDIQEPNSLDELKRSVEELGLLGLKMLAPYMERPFNDPDLEPIWRYLNDRQLPVLIHFGVIGGPGGLIDYEYINPKSIFPVARAFPNIPFIIPHFGAGYFQEVLHLAWSLPNIYVDSSGSNQWTDWMAYDIDLKGLFKKSLSTLGPERMIFGTDSSGFPRGFTYQYLEVQWRILKELGVSNKDQELFFSGNAYRLMDEARTQVKKHS